MIILDSHCDTPSQLLRRRNISIDNEHGHVDIPKLKRGCVDASFFALYTPASMEPDAATRYAMQMLAATMDVIDSNPSDLALALSADDIAANKAKGLVSILLGMENGSPIQTSLPLLREFYRMGVRYMTLTHNGDNEIADAASHGTRWHGLSPFGREVVEEMNRLGMIIDVAHASDETFYDCIKYSSKPVVSTHSCCRALAGHRRNMTDDMIRKMADKGGVIQINFYPVFLSDSFARSFDAINAEHPEYDAADKAFRADPGNEQIRKEYFRVMDVLKTYERPGVKEVVDHIDHAVKIGGIDHVGIGTDFDGIEVPPSGLEDVSRLGLVFDEMSKRGYSCDEIEKVAGGNFLRVLREA